METLTEKVETRCALKSFGAWPEPPELSVN